MLFVLLVVVLLVVTGQWSRTAPAADEPPAAAPSPPPLPAGASLFERPDEWSRVLRELPGDAVVTYSGEEGRFLRVTTPDKIVGYVLASACIPDMGTKG